MKPLVLIAAVAVAASHMVDSPVVQVRDVPGSPLVAIVGWNADDAQFGLRTRLRRDGTVQGDPRGGEDRLYLSSTYVDAHGGFAHAVTQDGKVLRNAGTSRDADACRFGGVCSPTETVGLAMSDEWLRQHRDSIIVTFRPQTGQKWSIRFDRPTIDAYLATVDSVSASMKKP